MAANPFPHLPPGYEPGPQSARNRAQRSFWSPVAAVVGLGMFMAGVWVAAGGRGGAFERQEELFGGVIFALGGLLCLYGAWVMHERGRPKRHPSLRGTSVTVDRVDLRRGEAVSVAVTAERRDGDRLQVGMVCLERYDTEVRVFTGAASAVRRETAEGPVHEEWHAIPSTGPDQAFTFRIPAEAPYSYEGECVSYVWLLTVRSVKPRRKDPRLEEPLWVRP